MKESFAPLPPEGADPAEGGISEQNPAPPTGEVVKFSGVAGEGVLMGGIGTTEQRSPSDALAVPAEIGSASSSPSEMTIDEVAPTSSVAPSEAEPGAREAQHEAKRETEALEQAIAEMPPEEREEIGWKLYNVGFRLEKAKSEGFAWVYDKIAGKFDERTTLGRFFGAMKVQFTEKAATTQKQLEDIETLRKEGKTEGLMKQFGNVGYLSGNLLKYGRILSDAVGWTAGAPTRWVTLGAMMTGSVLEGAKEARLANEEVKEETRVADISKAALEAWAVYEGAMKSKGLDPDGDHEGVSKEELTKAYQEKLPADILRRLAENPKEGTGSSLVQKLFQKHIEWAANRIQKKLDAVEADTRLDEKGKVAEREAIVARFGRSKMLNDFDRMLSQQGVIDTLAMSARYGEAGAKAVVYGMMADSLYRLWDRFGEAFAGKSWELPALAAADNGPLPGTETEFDDLLGNGEVGIIESQTAEIGASVIGESVMTPEELAAQQEEARAILEAGDTFSQDVPPDAEGVMTPEELAAQQERARAILEGEMSLDAAEGTHDVVRGDTLWKIANGNPAVLRLSPDELRSVGVSSGDAHLIRVGEKLDTGRLEELLRQKQELGNTLRHLAPQAFTERLAPPIPAELSSETIPEQPMTLEDFTDEGPQAVDQTGESEQARMNLEERFEQERQEALLEEQSRQQTRLTAARSPRIPDDQYSSRARTGEGAWRAVLGTERFPSGRGYHIEDGTLLPDRRLSELTPHDLARWPAGTPKPWPVDAAEADRLFGNPLSPNRNIAENFHIKVGRYPNEDEFRLFSRIQGRGEVVERQFISTLRERPYARLQAEEYERMLGRGARGMPYDPRGVRPRVGYHIGDERVGRPQMGYLTEEGRGGRSRSPFEMFENRQSSRSEALEQRARDIWLEEKMRGNPRADEHFERSVARAERMRVREMETYRGRVAHERERGGAQIARAVLTNIFRSQSR